MSACHEFQKHAGNVIGQERMGEIQKIFQGGDKTMKNGNVDEFIDHTTYEECAVMYRGTKYFFTACVFTRKRESIHMISRNGMHLEVMSSTFSKQRRIRRISCWQYFMPHLCGTAEPLGKRKARWNG